jgi:hypothetical protein
MKGMNAKSRLFVGAIILTSIARLLLVPGERVVRDAELRSAYEEYRLCMKVDVFCPPSHPCPQPNCMGEYLRNAEEINGRYRLVSTLERRNLLSGWRPYWNYTPAP